MSAVVVLLKSEPCWPWGLRFMAGADQHPVSGNCAYCRRDVALSTSGGRPVCIYCALDRGIVPALDAPVMEETHDAA